MVNGLRQKIRRISPDYDPLSTLLHVWPQTILMYVVLILAVEFQTIWLAPTLGTLYYGLILILILHHFLLAENDPSRNSLILIASIPMLRLLAMALPVSLVPPVARYIMVGLPVALGVFLLVKQTGLGRQEFGINLPTTRKREQFWENLLIALSGLPLGIIGFYFGDPIPLVTDGNWQEILAGTLVVFIFVAALEEVVFRGILLRTLHKLFGPYGILIATIVYLVLFASSHSFGMVFIMGFVSLLYSWHALESRSILAVTISHGLMFSGMLIFWPLIF